MKNPLSQQKKIRTRLQQFRALPKTEYYKELLFCLLTPQSNAQRCWQAVIEISSLKNPTHPQILKILSTKTRFHHTKTKRILQAPEIYKNIKPLLSNTNRLELRNSLAKQVNGFGLKEAGHFLRNIGLSDNQIAILDRHILKNLAQKNLIPEQKIKSPKHYLEIEQLFLNHAKSTNTLPDELDLLWWSQENGEIFK